MPAVKHTIQNRLRIINSAGDTGVLSANIGPVAIGVLPHLAIGRADSFLTGARR